MKRITAVAVTVVMGLSTVGFLPEAHAAVEFQQKAERKLLIKINRFRERKGLEALTKHGYIRFESRRHSKRMDKFDFFSHAGFQARADRIIAKDAGISGGICENIAWASGYTDYKQVWRVFFKGWRDSQGHKDCLLDVTVGAGTDSAGIGITRNGDMWHATYIAANDATPGWKKADR